MEASEERIFDLKNQIGEEVGTDGTIDLLLSFLRDKEIQSLNVLRKESDKIKLYRAQGTLEVTEMINEFVKECKKIANGP